MEESAQNAQSPANGQPLYLTSKRRIMRNVLIICVAWLMLFTAFGSLQTLQSSINTHEGLGTASLSVVYGSLVLSCMFLPSIMIQHLGCKWTIAISMTGYIVYIICNFWVSWFTIIPGSVIIGLCAAPLWSAKSTYLTEMSIHYSKLSNELASDVTARFFGYFFFFFQGNAVIGNVLASTILMPSTRPDYSNLNVSNCGIRYCFDTGSNENLKRPGDVKIFTLLGVYTGAAICGLCLIFLIDNIKHALHDGNKTEFNPRMIVATLEHMKNKYQLLLIPITIYSGLEQGYIQSEFTKAFVSCTLGIWMVGFVMICYGASDAIGSAINGKLNKVIGQFPIMLTGIIIHSVCLITFIFWRPGNSPSERPLFFIMAALWGLGDSVWQTQINALYGVAFPNKNEAAFANYRLWESIGFILAFGYSSALCVRVKTYIAFFVLLVSFACYAFVEFMIRKEKRVKMAPLEQRTNAKHGSYNLSVVANNVV